MLTLAQNNYARRCWVLAEAKRQVREKFPNLAEGSTGWFRAVENRRRRIR